MISLLPGGLLSDILNLTIWWNQSPLVKYQSLNIWHIINHCLTLTMGRLISRKSHNYWSELLTRGGNEIGVFVNTYQDGFCEHESTDFYETFQVTSYHLTWHFETKMVSQSFLVFQLEPKYEKLFDGMRKLLNKKTYRICSKEHRAQLFFSFSCRLESSE